MDTLIAEHPLATNAAPRAFHKLIPLDSPLAATISVNPGHMHGEPCFHGHDVKTAHLHRNNVITANAVP